MATHQTPKSLLRFHQCRLASPSGAALVRYSREDGLHYVLAAALRVTHERSIVFRVTPQAVATAFEVDKVKSNDAQRAAPDTEVTETAFTYANVDFREDELGFAKMIETASPGSRWGLVVFRPVSHRRWQGDGSVNFQWEIEPLTSGWTSAGKSGDWMSGQGHIPIAAAARGLTDMYPSAWAMAIDLATVFGGIDPESVPLMEASPKPAALQEVLDAEHRLREELKNKRSAVAALRSAERLVGSLRKVAKTGAPAAAQLEQDPKLRELLEALRR